MTTTSLPPGFPADPIAGLLGWIDEAAAAGVREASACALATVGPGGRPSARMVLARGFVEGGFAFYTDYGSRKGGELAENPACALVFHWRELERQARVEGVARRLSADASDAYFARRPRQSRLSAAASQQSRPLASREQLEALVAELETRYDDKPIPRPDTWGGFAVVPDAIELWRGHPARLHWRVRYERGGDGVFVPTPLQP